jgi:hypothetical protein
MQIEITEKEKTALSILLGLRQKFAREKKSQEVYSAHALHILFSELISKINSGELQLINTIHQINTETRPHNEIWGEIDEAIERSKIKRYDWDKVFGNSLTKEILHLKKSGLNVIDTYKQLSMDQRVLKFIDENKREKVKILKNLKISVHARYGENETAKKVMEGSDEE